jgi:hypothetical protein
MRILETAVNGSRSALKSGPVSDAFITEVKNRLPIFTGKNTTDCATSVSVHTIYRNLTGQTY